MKMGSETNVLASFPAGTHTFDAATYAAAPPYWPVSGLTETTLATFPEATSFQWCLHKSGSEQAFTVLQLRPPYRCGGSAVWERETSPSASR
jgi:hypothetical protein